MGNLRTLIRLFSTGVLSGILLTVTARMMRNALRVHSRRKKQRVWEIKELEEHLEKLEKENRSFQEEVSDYNQKICIKGKLDSNNPIIVKIADRENTAFFDGKVKDPTKVLQELMYLYIVSQCLKQRQSEGQTSSDGASIRQGSYAESLSDQLILKDTQNAGLSIKVQLPGRNKLGSAQKLGLTKLKRPVKESLKFEDDGKKLAAMILMPSAVVGLEYTLTENMTGVSVDTPLLLLGKVVYDSRKKEIVLTAIEGIFSNEEALKKAYQPNLFKYQIAILFFGLVTGMCILKIADIVTGKKKRTQPKKALGWF